MNIIVLNIIQTLPQIGYGYVQIGITFQVRGIGIQCKHDIFEHSGIHRCSNLNVIV